MKSFMQEKETKIWGRGCRKEEIEDRKERRGKRKGRRAEEQRPISNTSFSLECGPITREFIRMPNSLSVTVFIGFFKGMGLARQQASQVHNCNLSSSYAWHAVFNLVFK